LSAGDRIEFLVEDSQVVIRHSNAATRVLNKNEQHPMSSDERRNGRRIATYGAPSHGHHDDFRGLARAKHPLRDQQQLPSRLPAFQIAMRPPRLGQGIRILDPQLELSRDDHA
jgi:hypothetical protein